MFQQELEPSQWPSLMTTSLSLKEPVWSWSATTHLLSHHTSSGTCSTPTKDSSFSWSTCLETILFQASKVLRLNLGVVRSPSTWGKYQLIGKTQPSTSVLWVTQCLGLQKGLNTNLLGHCSSVFVIFRKLACFVKANSTDNTESWTCLFPMGILDFSFLHFFLVFSFFFIILQRKDSCFLKFGIFVLQNQNSRENEAVEFSTSWRKLLTLLSFGIVMGWDIIAWGWPCDLI